MANTIKLKTGSGSDPSASDLIVGEIAIRTDSGKLFTKKDNGSVAEISGGGGIDDGDKGDITVSNGGDTFTIDNGVVSTAKIADDAVTNAKIADNSIANAQLQDGVINTAKLATNSVSNVKIQDGVVTSAKIADGTIVNADINASAAIAGTKISPNFGSQNIVTTGIQSFGKSVYAAPSSENFFRVKFEDFGGTNNDVGIGQQASGSLDFNCLPAGTFTFNFGTTGESVKIDDNGHLTLTSTDTTSNASPVLELYRNSASPALADYLGQIKFTGESDDGSKEVYAKITGKIGDVSSGTEDGILEIAHRKAGSNNISARFTSTDLKLINGTGLEVAGQTDLSELLTVIKTTASGNDPILKALHSNLSQGISLGFNTISAIGTNTNVDLNIESKGSGHINIKDNLDCEAGLDVTGNISVSGTVDGIDISDFHAQAQSFFNNNNSGVLTNGVTATTQSAGNNTTRVATTAFVSTAISNLINNAPSALDTLKELSDALGSDANFSTTVTNSIATKMPLAGGEFTGDIISHNITPDTDSTRFLGSNGTRFSKVFADVYEGSGANLTNLPSQTDNNFTNADHSKLDGIEANATADQTASEIKTLFNSSGLVNAQIDASAAIALSKLATGTLPSGLKVNHNNLQTGIIEDENISSSAAIAGSKISPSFTSGISTTGNVTINGSQLTFSNNSGGKIRFLDTNNNPDYEILSNSAVFQISQSTNDPIIKINSNKHIDLKYNVDCEAGLDVTGELNVSGHSYLENISLTAGTPSINLIDSGNNPDYMIQNQDGKLIFTDITGVDTNRLVINTDGHVDVTGNLDVGAGLDVTGNIIASGTTTTSKLTINSTTPTIEFPESDGNPDYRLLAEGGVFLLQDQTNLANRFTVTTSVMAVKVNLAAEAGLDVTGDITSTGHIDLPNNKYAKFGNSDQFQVGHDNSNALLLYGTGTLFASGSNFRVVNSGVSENLIWAKADAEVELYYNNSLKFETSNTGCSVFGNIAVSGTVDGRDLATDGSKLDGIAAGATNVTNTNQLTNGAGYITSADGGNAATLDGIDSSQFLRSDANDTFSGILTLSSTSIDTLNFSGNATDDRRGISFNGKSALTADYNDGFLRLNNNAEFSNGVFVNSVLRADGGFSVDGTTVINGSAQLIASRLTGALPAIDGSNLTGISAGATGGGSDEVFYENSQTVTTNYTITNGKNAMSAGPITINSGVTVTVGSGETLTIV